MGSINTIDRTILSNNYYLFEFNIGKSTLDYADEFTKFVKSVERLVRKSKEYKYFKETLHGRGLDRCMILGNIDTTKADLEMHHGPYLTLYDVCSIITDHVCNSGILVNTEKIAQIVLDEHLEGNVQVCMLSQTIHDLVHDDKILINPKQSYGDINNFLSKYELGVNADYKKILKENNNIFKEMDDYGAEILIISSDIDRYKNIFKWNEY